MKKWVKVFVLLIFFIVSSTVFAKEVPFTLEDRDRLIRVETKLEEMDKRFAELREDMNKRFESIDKRFESIDKRFESIEKRFESIEKRFDQLINIFIGIVGAFAGIVAVTIGFAIWDRRTTVKPAFDRIEEVRLKQNKFETIFKEYARSEPKFAEVLRTIGLF